MLHREALVLQKLAVLLGGQPYPRLRLPFLLPPDIRVLVLKDVEGAADPGRVERERIRRLRPLEEGAVEGKHAPVLKALGDLTQDAALVLDQMDGVAEDDRVGGPLHQPRQVLGLTGHQLDDRAPSLLEVATRQLQRAGGGVYPHYLALVRLHLLQDELGDGAGAATQVDHPLPGSKLAQLHQPPVHRRIEGMASEPLERVILGGHGIHTPFSGATVSGGPDGVVVLPPLSCRRQPRPARTAADASLPPGTPPGSRRT